MVALQHQTAEPIHMITNIDCDQQLGIRLEEIQVDQLIPANPVWFCLPPFRLKASIMRSRAPRIAHFFHPIIYVGPVT
ncbi:hypothetical protein Taro_000414 [Colocasia esculenta]|uniref:Uncharacterized protein n=1 Tax=Colocasia esculenta TaxID=4460 RepID=A0A843TER4_COLES|nr:hypothetical protein [Colocasia esculenta]